MHAGSVSKMDGVNHACAHLGNLLMNALMWSCPIEILNVSKQNTMQLLLTEDQHVV